MIGGTREITVEQILPFVESAKASGCPADQVANFLKAGVILHPKQLLASAAARACDRPGGPMAVGFGGARGGGKALTLGTLLPTPSGWTTMEEVQVGDFLLDEDGKPCRVTAVSDVMHGHDVYEVVFDDDSTLWADGGHQWFTTTKKERDAILRRSDEWRGKRRASRPGRGTGKKPWLAERNSRLATATLPPPPAGGIRTTEEIRATLMTSGRSKPEVNHSIPATKPLQLPEADLPIDPYVLGVWLGDGTSQGGGLTTADDELVSLVEDAGHDVNKWTAEYQFGICDIKSKLVASGLINNKHIPPAYLRASESQRWALLAGLMDTDGTALPGGQCEFYNCNPRLIDDVWDLLLTLGIKCSICTGRATLNGKDCGPKYRIKFSTQHPVFRLTRKAERQSSTNSRRKLRRFIVDVIPMESQPVKCVTVDSPSHLYLAGRSMIPTHNSHWMVAQIGVDDCQRIPGLKCLLLRKIAKAGKEGFQDLKRRVFHSLEHDYRERDGVLTFPNESRIIIGHFKDEGDIDDYLGLEYDVIGIEEATTLSSRKLTNIESCNRTSKHLFRPRIYSTTNPGGISHAFYKKKFITPYRQNKQVDTRFVQSLASDNPSLNEEYEAKTLKQYTGWLKKAWVDGDWDIESGQYFTNFHYETHVVPRKGFDLPTTWPVWCSLDHGLTHYTNVYPMARDGDGNIYVLDEHAERNWLPRQHAEAIKAMLGRWETPLKKLEAFVCGADCFAKKAHDEEIGSIADDYRKEGIILERANIDRINGAKEMYRRLGHPVPEMSSSDVVIRPSLFILDSCPMLIECLPSLQRDPKRPEDVLKVDCDPDSGEGGDDPYDAARYGVMRYAATSRNDNVGPSIAGPKRDFATYTPR